MVTACRTATRRFHPEVWLRDLFASKAVQQGGVIRRKARDIERFAGMELFMREIHRRGYQVAENSGQIIIFCNRAPRSLAHAESGLGSRAKCNTRRRRGIEARAKERGIPYQRLIREALRAGARLTPSCTRPPNRRQAP